MASSTTNGSALGGSLSSLYISGADEPAVATRSLLAVSVARALGASVAVLAEQTLEGAAPAEKVLPAPAGRPRRKSPLGRLRAPLVAAANRLRRVLTRSGLQGCDRLHLGAGWRYLPGWGNIDLHGRRNLIWDLTRPLPVRPGSIRYIYSEHFVEHIAPEACRRLLLNARASLLEGGVLRISTPDLSFWSAAYLEGRLIQHQHSGWFPRSPCAMLNEQMRLWGHTFLYDEPELRRLLAECGFTQVERVQHGESRHAELRGLESRPPCGDLILEARP